MIDAGVVADDDYTLANQPAVRNAARMILEGIKVSSVSEGGYSISYDKEALERQIASLSGGGRPKVRALNVW